MSHTSSIFLDTTIHLERLLSTLDRRSFIQQNLSDKQICTSSTVYMEFKRTILQDVQFVYTVIASESYSGEDPMVRLSDVDRWLASGAGNFSPRSRDRCKLVTAVIKDEFYGHFVSRSELLLFLEGLVEDLDYYFFHVDIGASTLFDIREEGIYIDEAGCILSRPEIRPGDLITTRLACRAGNTECHLDRFLAAHVTELQDIHHVLAKLPIQQRDEKAFAALTEVLDNGFSGGLGERRCWALGDIVIALEAPPNAAIYTTNRKHFAPLCAVLDKKLFVSENR